MTRLNIMETTNFWDMVNSEKWKEAAEYGESLLKKDPRDGAGIRYGVMSAYAALGDDKSAEDLAIRYCEYAPVPDYGAGEEGYRSALTIYKSWSSRERATWTQVIESAFIVPLAMAYWKMDRLAEAALLLKDKPAWWDEYLHLSLPEIVTLRHKTALKGAYSPDTIGEAVSTFFVPCIAQVEFRKWANNLTDDMSIINEVRDETIDVDNIVLEGTDKLHHMNTYEVLGSSFFVDVFYIIDQTGNENDSLEGWLYRADSAAKHHFISITLKDAGSIAGAIEQIKNCVPDALQDYIDNCFEEDE